MLGPRVQSAGMPCQEGQPTRYSRYRVVNRREMHPDVRKGKKPSWRRALYYSDVILDVAWFGSKAGVLGTPRIRLKKASSAADPELEFCLYGENATDLLRHLRVVMHMDVEEEARKYQDQNAVFWVRSLEVGSSVASPRFTTGYPPFPGSATFMVLFGRGGWDAQAAAITPQFLPPGTTDFEAVARVIAGWESEFRGHLFYCSRFLNQTLPPDVRWLNGYRFLEWHFLRGQDGLAYNDSYRAFLQQHGQGLDADLRPGQSRSGLVEEVRALAAHAIEGRSIEPIPDRPGHLIGRTFATMEHLIIQILNQGAVDGVTFRPRETGPTFTITVQDNTDLASPLPVE
jgi:hypothetical protein